jgi:hypothetical protein
MSPRIKPIEREQAWKEDEMRKANGWLLWLVLVTLILGVSTGCSSESTRPKTGQSLRQVPLVIGKTFLPEFGDDSKGKPGERLDMVTDYEPDNDVLACIIGAKFAGLAAGYEFTPVQALKKGEKPRDIIASLKTNSDVFVLVRVSSRTADLGSSPMIMIMGDAALYRKDTMAPIESAGFIGGEKADSKEINGNKVQGEYWAKTVSSNFARQFDEKFLTKMQAALDGNKIREEIASVQAASAGALSPTIEDLPGGDKRDPELKIKAANSGTSAFAYLTSDDGKVFRKWLVGSAAEVDVVLQPGNYTLFVIQRTDKGETTGASMCKLKVEFKKRYTFNN